MTIIHNTQSDVYYPAIRRRMIGANMLNEPFMLLYHFLPLILFKTLDASLWQVALFVALNPIMSIASFYVTRYCKCLRSHFLTLEFIARLPFLCILFFPSPAYLLFASATYMLFSRASAAIWMEALKFNLSGRLRERLFSASYVLAYIEGMLLFGFGGSLDTHRTIWSFLLFGGVLLSLFGVIIQARITFPVLTPTKKSPLNWHQQLIQPWKDSIHLIRSRTDFALFQGAFMIGGGGLMLIATVLPVFFVNQLDISYASFSKARSLAMGFGVIVSSMLWARAMRRYHINFLAGMVVFFCTLYSLCLLLAPIHLIWLYIAYVVYGITQGGSHIIWHLSGPAFAGQENSIRFSSINLVTVGIRGVIFPFLGGLLCGWLGPVAVLMIGFCLFAMGAYWVLRRYFSTTVHGRVNDPEKTNSL